MDIRQWAEGVVTEMNQGGLNQPNFPEFLLPKPANTNFIDLQLKRHHPSDGSTFLETPVAAIQGANHADGVRRDGVSLDASDEKSQGSETKSNNSSSRYKRRPRKKPRVDLYERPAPRFDRRKTDVKMDESQARKHGDRKKKRHKRKDAGHHSKPSVPVEYPNRLTLHYESGIGLFGNVKTSSSRRPTEVPDLSFSRMPCAQLGKDSQAKEREGHEDSSSEARQPISKTQREDASTNFNPDMKMKLPPKPKKSGRRSSKSPSSIRSVTTYSRSVGSLDANSKLPGRTRPKDQGIRGGETRCHDAMSPSALEPISWSESGKALSTNTQHPLTAEAVGPGDFKFRPGPYRSSSFGLLREPNASIEVTAQPPSWAHSNQAAHSGKLSCDVERRSSKKVFRPEDCAQQSGRCILSPHNRSAKSTVFGPHMEEHSLIQGVDSLGSSKISFGSRDMTGHDTWDYNQSLMNMKAPASIEEHEKPDRLHFLIASALYQCDKSRDRLQSLESTNREWMYDAEEDEPPPDEHVYKYRRVKRRSRRETHALVGDRNGRMGRSARESILHKEQGNVPYAHDADDTDVEQPGQDLRCMPEEEYDILPVEEQSAQGPTVLQIPCIGGLEAETFFYDEQQSRECRSRGSFWRPNRLY